MKGVVYRAFAADGELLYIGATVNPGARLHAHGRDRDWWTEVASITLEHHASRDAAFAAERRAILGERPRYNRPPGMVAEAEATGLGGRIRKARLGAGLTQAQLAEKIGYCHRSIPGWELNEKQPRQGVLLLIAAATDRPVAWFEEAVA